MAEQTKAAGDGASPMATDPTGSLDTLLVFNIMRTHNYVSPYIDRSLRELQLTSSQLDVLLVLLEEPDGVPLSEIGRRLVVTKANVTGLIDRLEKKEFVERGSGSDRRVCVARITDSGRELVGRILPDHEKLLARLVDCLGQEEKRQLVELLSRLRKGLREKCWKHAHEKG